MANVTVALVLVVSSLARAATHGETAPSPDLFAQIFQRSLVKQKTMRTIRARFTETTVSTLLEKPIVARGTVIAAAPARVRLEYTSPEPKTIVMDGQSLVVVWEGRGSRERIDVSEVQKRVDQYFRNASIDELKSMFAIDAEPDRAVPNADRIDMQPKRKQIKAGLERLELWVDRTSDLLVQMRMTFPGGDQKTIALEDIEVNVPVTDATFRPPPP